MAEVLQEYFDSRGVTVRVDQQEGILRGVKLIGLESRNGRRYRESALAQAVGLYEESKVNVNHPKEGPLAPRDYQDRLGVIRGVELRPGEGLFGDLHFNPKHVLAEQLAWDAQHNPRNVGFSHNVLARVSRRDEISIVEEITRVQSVDLVADPAATQGLFEQTGQNGQPAGGQVPTWDAFTLEHLRLHRPDLVQELESTEMQRLRVQLDTAQTRAAILQRRQQIVDLLCKHRLPVPTGENDDANRIVSPSFIEMLMNVEDENKLEQLITERAELVRSIPVWKNRLGHGDRPQSRDPMSMFAPQNRDFATAQDFSQALKSSRH